MTSNTPGTRYHVILPDPAGTAALVCLSDAGVSLPAWSHADRPFWQAAPPVVEGIQELLGLSVTLLRACRLDRTDDAWNSFYVVEALDAGWEPPAGTRWVTSDAVDLLAWACPVGKEVLRAWFDDRPAETRTPWYRPGWHALVTGWLDDSLDRAGLARLGGVEQLRSWERSSIMRVETNGGLLYFKAVAPQWGHEPALTRWLAERFPDLTPVVVAADPACGRLLARAFEGKPLPESKDINLWQAAYRALGRIQRELTGSTDELRNLGVLVRPLDAIRGEIPSMLANRRRMRAGMDQGLSDGEIARIHAAAPLLIEACERLASGPIPLSIDHGDFWPGNTFASPERITIFDWSDATLTHPFFSLVMAADEIAEGLPGQPEAADRVIDAYLAEWTAFGSMDELRATLEDAMLVAPLHQALMYRDVYLPAMEFVDELDRMTPHFLRWLAGEVGDSA